MCAFLLKKPQPLGMTCGVGAFTFSTCVWGFYMGRTHCIPDNVCQYVDYNYFDCIRQKGDNVTDYFISYA